MKEILILPLLLITIISLAEAAHHDSVCVKGGESPASGAKTFPAVPDVYQVDIQMNVAVNKTTKHLFQVFDSPNGRAIIGETEATGDYKNISLTGYNVFNFFRNEIVENIQLPDGSYYCNASQLDGRAGDTFMFGDSVNSQNGFTAKSAFMIDDLYPPVYQGKEVLSSGLMVEKWSDCHWIPAMDATVKLMWYFTDSDSWASALGVQIPMMLTVQGYAYHPNPQGRRIDHSYTFTGFQDFISKRAEAYFQVPEHTICPFLKNFDVGPSQNHDMPQIAAGGYFSFKAEYVQQTGGGAGLVTAIREFYDNQLSMSRFDYVPEGMMSNFFTSNTDHPVVEVHDFITGLAYIKDDIHGNCTTVPLMQSPNFDVWTADNNYVRMKTVSEFFGISGTEGSKMNWTYTGQRKVRDMLADVYIAERRGFPPHMGPDTRSTWEISFMLDSYLQVSRSADVQVNEPIKLWIKVPDLDYEMSYNIFDFDESEPDTLRFDISACFTDEQKTNVQFKIPADQKALIENNNKEFTYWVLISIIGYLDILPSRVANLGWQVNDDNKTITIYFQILDPPTILGSTGNDIPSKFMIPTSDAFDILKSAIDGGTFVLEEGSIGDDTLKPLIPIAGSVNKTKVVVVFNETTVTVTVVDKEVKVEVKLAPEEAAGFAIGFFVIGIGAGVLIIFLVNKFRARGAGSNLTLSFSPKTFDN